MTPTEYPSNTIPCAAPVYTPTPLALAALNTGIKFDDVQSYLAHVAPSTSVELLETLIAPPYGMLEACDETAIEVALDAALERSVAAQLASSPASNLEAARLWWRGVL